METEVLQSLEDAGYTGSLLNAEAFNQALQLGAKSTEFTSLISFLTNQIGAFGHIDETVHPTSTAEDASTFLLELSTFLKELGCVNKKLTTGNVNQRISTVQERLTLLEFLITELMASKILEANKPEDNKAIQITVSESITAKSLREMLTALRFQKPPDNISADALFKKLHAKVSELTKQVPKELIGKPLFFGELNKNQWEKLDKVHGDLNEEYTIRREMLLKRLDVTVNSFTWSERIRPKEDELNKCYHTKRDAMKREPDVTLAHLLSARDDLAIVEKTSSASVRKNTRSAINKVIIGAVPDRGGRPCEQEPPPPEMPPWQKDRVQGPQRGGFGGGGRGGDRGGGRGGDRGGGRGGDRGGGRGGRGDGLPSSGGGYRDNKSAASNFGQNYSQNSSAAYSNQSSDYGNKSYGNQSTGGYGSQSGYGNQSSGYGSQSSGQSNQSSGYRNQGSSGYSSNQGASYSSNQGSAYSNNQGSSYNSNQGDYERRSGGGNYNKSGQNRGGRVQGGWNQDSNYNQGGYNNRGQGGRKY